MLARCLPLLIGVLLAVPAEGDPSPQAPAADFSAGFSRLVALGLPVLDANAHWSTLPDASDSDRYWSREFFKSLKGNGWSMPAAAGKTLGLPAGGLETFVFDSAGKPAPDLTKDVRALIAALSEYDQETESFADGFHGDGHVLGRLLLLATQIDQTGNTALANELAAAVFDLTPSRETAVDSAVSLIADRAYEAVVREFFASNDWVAYHRALTGLMGKFPRGWLARDAVAMLIPQVAKQAAGEHPAVPSLPSIALDPQSLAAVSQLTVKPTVTGSADDEELAKRAGAKLSSIPPAMRPNILASLRGREMEERVYMPPFLWLLEPPKATVAGTFAIAKLTSRGMAALPVLAALVDDPYLTYLPNPKANDRPIHYSSSEGGAARTLGIHEFLNRPATRGEIACDLLRRTLPNESNTLYEASPETLRELALAFWKKNQQAAREQLAAVFLRDGSAYQIQDAATLLASSADPRIRQTFENFVLASDPAITRFQSVQTYLSTRKAAARPFFDAYAKLVRSQDSAATEKDPSNPYYYQIAQAGGTEKILNRLAIMVTGGSPRDIAREIAKGNPTDADDAINSLIESMKGNTPVERLDAMLEGAIAAEDPLIRWEFLSAIPECDGNRRGPILLNAPDRPLAAAEIEIWRKLIADTRQLPGHGLPYRLNHNPISLGDIAASMMEMSINLGHHWAAREAAPVLGKPEEELFRERAAARLAGKPIPPLPDASRVAPDRLRVIINEAGAKSAPHIHPYLNTLTPDERAAWLEWLRKPGEITGPQSVGDLRFLVIARTHSGSRNLPDIKNAGNIDTGYLVTSATIRNRVDDLATNIAKYSRTRISLSTAGFGPGLEVVTQVFSLTKDTVIEKPDIQGFGESGYQFDRDDIRSGFDRAIGALDDLESVDGAIVVTLSSHDGYDKCSAWLVVNGKANPAIPEQPSTFDKALENLMDSQDFDPFDITIIVLSKADAIKLADADGTE